MPMGNDEDVSVASAFFKPFPVVVSDLLDFRRPTDKTENAPNHRNHAVNPRLHLFCRFASRTARIAVLTKMSTRETLYLPIFPDVPSGAFG